VALVRLRAAPSHHQVLPIDELNTGGIPMISALLNLSHLHAGDLTLAVLLSPPPLDPTNLLKDIFTWLVRILGAVGMLYFVIDLFKHVATSPRDLGAAGKDALIMVVLLAVAAKADVLVAWAQSAL
jgi:hypothetical protein